MGASRRPSRRTPRQRHGSRGVNAPFPSSSHRITIIAHLRWTFALAPHRLHRVDPAHAARASASMSVSAILRAERAGTRGGRNPLVPDHATQACERIDERRGRLGGVPRALRPGGVCSAVRDVPEPHGGTDPKRQGGGPLGPLPLPTLWLLATEGLLHRPEGVLDRPAPGVAGDDVGGNAVEVGGEEVVVLRRPRGRAPPRAGPGPRAIPGTTAPAGPAGAGAPVAPACPPPL